MAELEQKAAAVASAAAAAGSGREEAAEVVTGPARVGMRANVTVPTQFVFPGRACALFVRHPHTCSAYCPRCRCLAQSIPAPQRRTRSDASPLGTLPRLPSS